MITIEKLIELIRKKSLTPEELKAVNEFFSDNKGKDELEKFLLKTWDSSSRYSTDYNVAEGIKSIHNKLNLQHNQSFRQKSISKQFVRILKYAAIFILAFLLSWFINKLINPEPDTAVYLTKNNEVAVSYGSKSKIKLPDGTEVNLNSGSKISYPAIFTEKKREVFLEGEAYFEVNADSSRPFYVKTSDITIRVVGTVFNIKSYPESNTIETTLLSGKLELSDNKSNSKNKSIVLDENQKAVFIKDLNKLSVDDRHEIKQKSLPTIFPAVTLQEKDDTEEETAWKDNRLVFNNKKFRELTILLERWYDVKIFILTDHLKEERFTGTFENETIEQVIEALMITEPFKYDITKNNIKIYK